MRRVTLTLAAVMVLTFATALPVASSGLTDVTVSCDDGSSFTFVGSATLLGRAPFASRSLTQLIGS